MNIFTAKKKPKAGMPWDESVPDEQIFPPSNHPTQRRAWGRKKTQPEIAPPVVEVPVLPSQEDFRTSLLMPNLSARFSMLRDQDNPHSILGKASDDSVLQPHRRSRLYHFGHNAGGLMDIAEVSSIAEPITTPTVTPRKGSYTYGQGPSLDDGASIHSIMDRSRQGQGNTLFGGRQRTFKAKKSDNGPDTMMGRRSPRKSPRRRAEETSASAFRKLRQEERQRERDKTEALLTRGEELEMDDWTTAANEFFAPSSHDEKRATISSTTSGPSTISLSTAATTSYSPSVSKPPPAMPSLDSPVSHDPPAEPPMPTRTYEQGLAQYRYDQQAAALTRLNSVKHLQASTRARTPLVAEQQPKAEPQVPTETELPHTIATAIKAVPPLELDKLTTFDSIRRIQKPAPTPDVPTSPNQPLSPFDEDSDSANMLSRAIDPNDRGKATATGLFRKPSKFDEKQYLQRQLSIMQQQRKKRRSVLLPTQMKPTFPGEGTSPTKSQRPRPAVEVRPRADTGRSDRSWEGDRDESTAFTAVQNAPLDEATSLLSADSDEENAEEHHPDASDTSQKQSHKRGSLERSTSDRALREIATPPRHTPALVMDTERSENWSASTPKSLREKRNGWSPDRLMTTMAMAETMPIDLAEQDLQRENDENVDPVPEKAQIADLKGLVRAHLRQVSNVSSICPSPGNRRPVSHIRIPSMYNADNSWDSEGTEILAYRGTSRSQTPTPGRGHLSPTSANSPAKPTLHRLVTQEPKTRVGENVEREIRQHARGGSTETQHERQAFARELVQRQRAIQENLRIKVENENRSPSPTNANKNVFDHHFKPFGVLRAMSSRDSLHKTQEPFVKPYKWVDMSAGESEAVGKPHAGLDAITTVMRDVSPTTGIVGRTLHSRLRENTSPRGSEVLSKRLRPVVAAEIRPGPFASSTKQQDSDRAGAIDATSDTNQSRPSTAVGSRKDFDIGAECEMPEELIRKSGESVAVSARQPQSLASTTRSRNGTSESKASILTNTAIRSNVEASDPKETPRKQGLPVEMSPAARVPETPSTVSSTPTSATTSHWHDAQTPQSASPSTAPSSAFSSARKESDTLPMSTFTKPTPIVSTSSRPQQNLFPAPSPNLPSTSRIPPLQPAHPPLPSTVQHSRGPNLNWTYPANRPRKYHGMGPITKSDISEPTLIASTSSVDTVALPKGASLRNGMTGEIDDVLAGGGIGGYWADRSMDVGGVGRLPMERKEKDKDRRGFLARVGRVASSERKAERERERAMQQRLQNMI